MNKVFLVVLIFLILSCESDEIRKVKANEAVNSFITNLNFENYENHRGVLNFVYILS
jgi:hypothetical protein